MSCFLHNFVKLFRYSMEFLLIVIIIALIVGLASNNSIRNRKIATNKSMLIINNITGEVISKEDAARLTKDRSPLEIKVRLSHYKKDRNILKRLNIGDNLIISWNTWTEGEEERHHYSIFLTDLDKNVIATVGYENRQDLAYRYDYIQKCTIKAIDFEEKFEMTVLIEFS